jgi:hypothetical protein
MAEYFDVDPALVRLLWVAAAIVTWGAAVGFYIVAWIVLPRDDSPPVVGPHVWRDWSQEFHSETQRLADEARRVADDVRDAGESWRAPGPPAPPPVEPTRNPAADKGAPSTSPSAPPESAWWQSNERYVERHRNHGRHPRSTGIVLVGLGVLLLAGQQGWFNWLEWKMLWPVIFIGLGVLLLARQSGWNR